MVGCRSIGTTLHHLGKHFLWQGGRRVCPEPVEFMALCSQWIKAQRRYIACQSHLGPVAFTPWNLIIPHERNRRNCHGHFGIIHQTTASPPALPLLTSHMILMCVTLSRVPEAPAAPAAASEPGLGWSVRTDRTKSPGLLRLSRTKKVQGVALAWSRDSAAGPDRCPWYHLRKNKERVKKEVEMREVDAFELMSEKQQHWGRVREEERKGETERKE